MSRLTSLVLLGAGAVLLVTWLVSPASSAPPAQPAAAAAAPDVVAPDLADINREVDRLRERLSVPVEQVPPVRDPFQFDAPLPRVAESDAPAMRTEPVLPIEPVVAWPRLVAILTPDETSPLPRRAAFEDAARGIRIVTEGESIDGFVIGPITPRDVVVSQRDGDRSTRLSLR